MNRIKEFREKSGKSIKALSLMCGWQGPSKLCNYESGIRTPTLENSRVIVYALNRAGVFCTLDQVFPPETEITNSAGDDAA